MPLISVHHALDTLLTRPEVAALPDRIEAAFPDLIEETIRIQQIPAPTFDESLRAAYVRDRFIRAGLIDVQVDSLYNVVGRLPGANPDHSPLLVCAHTDTVFPFETDLDAHRDANQIVAPGIGDNSLGVSSLLGLLDLFAHEAMTPNADIWFVANSREEGMGDLGGIRGAYEALKPYQPGAAIVIEGMALGRIYHSGIAVRRLNITCEGMGGHSWLHFGRQSAIHGLMKLGAQICLIQPPESPRTTYNIGMVSGGRSVNSIADHAEMLLDMRSESKEGLAALERAVMSMIDSQRSTELQFKAEVVGDRPAGAIPRQHPLVQLARGVLETVGVPPVFETGSTDANYLLAQGLPTVTIGITQGGNAHRTDEYIQIAPIREGMWQLALLALAACEL